MTQKKVDINFILSLVIEAGEISKKYFCQSSKQDIKFKKDKSEVTKADKEINDFFNTKLKLYAESTSIISEENSFKENKNSLYSENYFVIDPLDGTRAFVNNSDQHTINFSYVKNNTLIFSIIYAPQKKIIFFSNKNILKKGFVHNKLIENINIIKYDKDNISKPIRVLLTKRLEEKEKIYKELDKQKISYNGMHISSSLKFCYMVENFSDIYIRMVNIKFWDVIAGFHICMASGLSVHNYDNTCFSNYSISDIYKENLIKNNFSVDKFYIKHKNLLYKNIL